MPVRIEGFAPLIQVFDMPTAVVDAAYAYLREKGVSLDPPTVAPCWMKQLYLKDADGYVICFQWAAH
jgi:hypothetical protein